MPTRLIREGYLDSERISKAGEKAEVLFIRLMLVADDYGRFDGRVSVICRRCWPLGEPTDPTEIDVTERLSQLATAGLLIQYEHQGKPFIYIPKFKQRTRATKSKYPEPPAGYPQDDGPATDTSQPQGWHTPDKGQASASVVRSSYSYSNSAPPVDKSRSTQKATAHSATKTQQQLSEQRAWPQPSPVPSTLLATLRKAAATPTTREIDEPFNDSHSSVENPTPDTRQDPSGPESAHAL
jgi:hypothetical protein